ncbi:tRNA lysidine(34) synthetase TilS [Tuberibacillus sp. Marseille-P3662]|uniref:tRNA lysidine(34) synthetase TilS n=1 Tax=Tuberibacillus sp. Marseille-P3662 TaxID=1965358 RepID=UPI001594A7C9|nr:tRNA lysidine(34) synthetase TilS [Tuberibacillus sp. Marseille-P3662]
MKSSLDAFIKKHRLLAKNSTVVVGVSGGPDSLALLHYLHVNQSLWHINIVAVSVDHMLRGEASRQDVNFVAKFCDQHDILFEGRCIDVNAYKQEHHLNTQEAARECRYHFFHEMMIKYNGDYLALAHHGDDQVETMLMRQVRGSFGQSKAGIPFKRSFADGFIIRPMLTVDKETILAYCDEHGLEPREDPSNDADTYTRNRFRHHVLPFLKSENPKVHHRFQQDSEMMASDDAYLTELAQNVLQELVMYKDSHSVIISVHQFIKTPIPLQRRLIHLILSYLYNHTYQIQSVHIENIFGWLQSASGYSELHLPKGAVLIISYDRLIFNLGCDVDPQTDYHIKVNIPGITNTPVGYVTASRHQDLTELPKDRESLVVDYEQLTLPLYLRSKKDGDRIRSKGLNGTQKVKDIFINQKVEYQLRGRWPLLVDANDKILWLPLLKESEWAVPEHHTKEVLVFSYMPTGIFGRIT